MKNALNGAPDYTAALLSAISTSPLGKTQSQREWSKLTVYAVTHNPSATTGVLPASQPITGAMFTVGIKPSFGARKSGFSPQRTAKSTIACSRNATNYMTGIARAAPRISNKIYFTGRPENQKSDRRSGKNGRIIWDVPAVVRGRAGKPRNTSVVVFGLTLDLIFGP